MDGNVVRLYIEKKPEYNGAAAALLADLRGFLGVKADGLRLLVRYDAEGMDEADFARALPVVFSDPVTDIVIRDELPPLEKGVSVLAYETLPGQFDLRADSCESCVQLLLGGERPRVRCATVLLLDNISPEDFDRVAAYVINPVECGRASLDKPATLRRSEPTPAPIPVLHGFGDMDEGLLTALHKEYGLAMDMADVLCMQRYFREEGRNPSLTELRVLDTYWSDHCRHTTFSTRLTALESDDPRIKEAMSLYWRHTESHKPLTLMNIATAAMKALHKAGRLPGLVVSEENNACTVRVMAETVSGTERWLLLFKNETHNHPTEIEPFGGAATCLGGAIRDPLSGRAYVYQAMRITGSGDPRAPLKDTLPGKLPQRKLTVTAAGGYSSYGNQIGIPTGFVREIYHPGYQAKRMEVGAVVGAAPESVVRREEPAPGDVVLLLGGRTGRDGIGGATGSSKSHDRSSVDECAAEVQKGNAPEEHKLQRLFRKNRVTRLIKRCNDFGAGGVAVAVGELAPGLRIDLDRVPKKYAGLDGTELAVSESQERMAVVCAPEDAALLVAEAAKENLECTVIAEVTAEPRLVMCWQDKEIVNLSRAFLDTAGAPKAAAARIPVPKRPESAPWDDQNLSLAERMLLLVSDLRFCSQQGLCQRFDGSVGAGSVFASHGGTQGDAPEQVMAALLPAKGCLTASVMSYGFDPYLTDADPFGGGMYSVIHSLAKLAAAGCAMEDCYLSLQEYFPRPDSEEGWGRPAAAVLGAFCAQMGLGVAAIGGKDSMSGTYALPDGGKKEVPATLIAFAAGTAKARHVTGAVFTATESHVYLLSPETPAAGMPQWDSLRRLWDRVCGLIRSGTVLSAYATGTGGVPGALAQMCMGRMGMRLPPEHWSEDLWHPAWGSILVECCERIDDALFLGNTQLKLELQVGKDFIPLNSLIEAWKAPLEGVFPTKTPASAPEAPHIEYPYRAVAPVRLIESRPLAVITAFPGTNSEYDTAAAVEAAGGRAQTVVIRNLHPEWLADSVSVLSAAIRQCQMLIIPGGFSGGDEPDGSAKLIAAFFRNPAVTDAVRDLLHKRGGLMLGICNGFQALVRLGLVPFGDILEATDQWPTLTHNTIGRHQARYVNTRVASVLSPWLSRCAPGELHTIPISHGEGRFIAPADLLESLTANGQIATQYCDPRGKPGMDIAINPNGSALAIEGITSADGRILGKMGHTERAGRFVGKNIQGVLHQPLFEGGVRYFT